MKKRGMPVGYKILSDEYLISKLQEAALILSPISYRGLKSLKGFPSLTSYERRFGSLKGALNAAHIAVNPRKNATPKGSKEAMAWGKKMASLRRKDVLKNPAASLRMRFEIFNRDNFTCQYCGRTPHDGVKLVVDHKLAVANGGETKISNLITSCFECNSGKSDLILFSHRP